MSKGQHGNREAKKPKKDAGAKPLSPQAIAPLAVIAVAPRQKKK